ncbi:hypothetical protein DFJ74DRAFT_655525 [Hyaloraphidium curvatum]|nr:hypothetical protein DFJ74DRAFT_655525 [Hyaloraphidium curvatum]
MESQGDALHDREIKDLGLGTQKVVVGTPTVVMFNRGLAMTTKVDSTQVTVDEGVRFAAAQSLLSKRSGGLSGFYLKKGQPHLLLDYRGVGGAIRDLSAAEGWMGNKYTDYQVRGYKKVQTIEASFRQEWDRNVERYKSDRTNTHVVVYGHLLAVWKSLLHLVLNVRNANRSQGRKIKTIKANVVRVHDTSSASAEGAPRRFIGVSVPHRSKSTVVKHLREELKVLQGSMQVFDVTDDEGGDDLMDEDEEGAYGLVEFDDDQDDGGEW